MAEEMKKVTKMFSFNPKDPGASNVGKEPVNYRSSDWWAKVDDNDKLVVWEETKKDIKYCLECIENPCHLEWCENAGIWYSFDPATNNFHIVPADENAVVDIVETQKAIIGEIQKRGRSEKKKRKHSYAEINGTCYDMVNSCGINATKNHKYISVDIEKSTYQYLLSFNRLWCDFRNHIHNNFGQVQFMRYRIKCDSGKELADRYQNINWDVGPKFKMMYPISGEDGEGRLDPDSGHIVYNVPFDITRDAGTIAKAFSEFIRLGELVEKGEIKAEEIPKKMNEYCETLKCPTT